eukprot:TRINITY_DN14848_c0_g1_i1.p1 TRINITY_DN14848_c0_g1~~TRINITY_DN14848_c0_g1_i1.p1  ORF type:complete len:1003 (-),score=169.22 TRINITY_DN14848_c0_g1_i1:8-3016(-)
MRQLLLLALAFLGAAVDVNVHLVEHTHDDVGWQTTVNGYYVTSVRNILDQAYTGLMANPNRRYTYVEIAFFQLWWAEQTDDVKANVRKLVADGRLEFTNGGWCMSDEAAVHYSDFIDQMTLGHAWLQAQFGPSVMPFIGWQIDPFGHTSGAAWLFAKIGFNALQFGRAPDGWGSSAQLVWQPFSSFLPYPKQQNLLTYYHQGYCGSPPSAFDNATMLQWAQQRISEAQGMATPDVIQMYGCDFSTPTFDQADALVKYFQQNTSLGVKVFYSTPGTFFKSTFDANAEFRPFSPPSNDFLPYWTGFFTSQQGFKRYVRVASAYYHAATALHALAPRSAQWKDEVRQLNVLWMALGVTQHHDGVTGTSQPFVYDDVTMDCYECRLNYSTTAASRVVSGVVERITGLTNVTSCPPGAFPMTCPGTERVTKNVVVWVLNPLPTDGDGFVHLPVASNMSYVVQDNTGAIALAQVSEYPAYPKPVLHLTWRAFTSPLGIVTYTVQGSQEHAPIPKKLHTRDDPITIENEYILLTFNSTGTLQSVTEKATGTVTPVTVDVLWYQSAEDGNDGAYDFSAAWPGLAKRFPGDTQQAAPTVVSGYAFSEVSVPIDAKSHIQLNYRLYQGQKHVRILTAVGPVDISDDIGKNVILRVSTGIDSNGTFYTDSNGLELTRRHLGVWWPTDVDPSTRAGRNYYPMTVMSSIRDNATQLVLLTDRSEGVGSQASGQLEAMIYRRLIFGDGKGMDTPLNTTVPITTEHWLMVGAPADVSKAMRQLARQIYNPPVVGCGTGTPTASSWQPMPVALPDNVHLQTLQVVLTNWSALACAQCEIPPPPGRIVPPEQPSQPGSLPDGGVLLRLAHIYAVDEDPALSQPVTVNLSSLFSNWKVVSPQEYSLSYMRPIGQQDRWDWRVANLSRCAWRQTSYCKADGPRQAQFDKPCSQEIPGGMSGYCECEGKTVKPADCGHPTLRCADFCANVTRAAPLQILRDGASDVSIVPMDIRSFLVQLAP